MNMNCATVNEQTGAEVDTLLDRLIEDVEKGGGLADRTAIVYIWPPKALSNDINPTSKRLYWASPASSRLGSGDNAIRPGVRTGDAPRGASP